MADSDKKETTLDEIIPGEEETKEGQQDSESIQHEESVIPSKFYYTNYRFFQIFLHKICSDLSLIVERQKNSKKQTYSSRLVLGTKNISYESTKLAPWRLSGRQFSSYINTLYKRIDPDLDIDKNQLLLELSQFFVRLQGNPDAMKFETPPERDEEELDSEEREYQSALNDDSTLDAWLKRPGLIARACREYKKAGIVEENRITTVVLFCALSAYMKESQRIWHIGWGASGVGKDAPAKAILKQFPPEDILALSRQTETFLDNFDVDLNGKILYEANFRFKRSAEEPVTKADKIILTMATEERAVGTVDPETRKGYIKKLKGKPVMLVTSTEDPGDELSRRFWRSEPKRTKKKGDAIIDLLTDWGIEGEAGVFKPRPFLTQLVLFFKENVKEVAIPWLPTVGEKVKNLWREALKVRIWSDYPKIQSAIRISAILNQKQRELNDKGMIIASPLDYINVLVIFSDLLDLTIADISVTSSEILKLCEEEFDPGEEFTVTKAAEVTKFSKNFVREHLKSLKNQEQLEGYLDKTGGGHGFWKFSLPSNPFSNTSTFQNRSVIETMSFSQKEIEKAEVFKHSENPQAHAFIISQNIRGLIRGFRSVSLWRAAFIQYNTYIQVTTLPECLENKEGEGSVQSTEPLSSTLDSENVEVFEKRVRKDGEGKSPKKSPKQPQILRQNRIAKPTDPVVKQVLEVIRKGESITTQKINQELSSISSDNIEQALQYLMGEGEIMEPRPGEWRVI